MYFERLLILIAFILNVILILIIYFGDANIVSSLKKEDNIVENLSAIFYLIGLIVSFFSIFRNKEIIIPILWSILCLLFLGEETSWFQRLFAYSVPVVEQFNVQNEFNIHNLSIFQGGSWINSSFDLDNLLKSQNIFRLGFFSYFIIIPFLFHIFNLKEFAQKIGYKKIRINFIVVLLFVFILSFLATIFAPVAIKGSLAEAREMLYAFFIMIYTIIYIWTDNKK